MIEKLKKATLKKYNQPVSSAKECKLLAEQISLFTLRNISEATIRRFFGLLSSSSSLSKYNLDTLAIFCDYENYNGFIANNDGKHLSINVDYEKIIIEFKKITDSTLKSIKRQSLTNFKQTIPRTDLNTKIDTFIKSDYTLLPIVAPGGYGKSLALAHWVSANKNSDNIILFCHAKVLNQIVTGQYKTGSNNNFHITASQNIFSQLEMLNGNSNGKFIMVADAYDELIYDENQLKMAIDFLHQTIEQNKKTQFVKVIFCSRITTWNNYILPKLSCDNAKKAPANLYSIKQANISKLSVSEVCSIINAHKTLKNGEAIYNCLSWFVKEMIRIPINLYLFLSIYDETLDFSDITRNSLYKAYLNKLIFTSKYAETKEDIIWELLEQLEEPVTNFEVNKTEFKKILPIHLKRETAYYQAYHQLINDGFLIEERIKNKYGIYTTTIKFKHLTFFNYLSVLNIIRKNNGINSKLFQTIVQSNNPTQWKTFVVSILFEIAYENNDIEALSNFCELPDEILKSLEVRMSVGLCFRIKNNIRDKIIQLFAASPKGQTYFFEQFVDINYLFNNYEYRIRAYLQYKQTKESILFGNNLLFTSGLLALDNIKCHEYFNEIKGIELDENIHPWPIGRKTANTILYKHFVTKKYIVDYQDLISKNRAIAYNYLGYLAYGLIEFELPIMIALSLTHNYDLLYSILLNTEKQYNTIQNKKDIQGIMYSNQNALPTIFLAYATFKIGKGQKVNLLGLLNEAEQRYYSNMDDYEYRILILWFLCDYNFQINNTEFAEKYWEQAFELSKLADYRFYMVWLLLNYPNNQLDNKHKAKNLLNGTNFEIDSFLIN